MTQRRGSPRRARKRESRSRSRLHRPSSRERSMAYRKGQRRSRGSHHMCLDDLCRLARSQQISPLRVDSRPVCRPGLAIQCLHRRARRIFHQEGGSQGLARPWRNVRCSRVDLHRGRALVPARSLPLPAFPPRKSPTPPFMSLKLILPLFPSFLFRPLPGRTPPSIPLASTTSLSLNLYRNLSS